MATTWMICGSTVMFEGSDNTVYFDRVALKCTRNE